MVEMVAAGVDGEDLSDDMVQILLESSFPPGSADAAKVDLEYVATLLKRTQAIVDPELIQPEHRVIDRS